MRILAHRQGADITFGEEIIDLALQGGTQLVDGEFYLYFLF